MEGKKQLNIIARRLIAPNKGILAADESTPTISKRFESLGIESTEDLRRAWRNLLFTTPGIEKFLSGVILFDETLRQSTDEGVSFARYLKNKGIIPGIKVDKGTKDLPGWPGEKVTEGLEGLPERLEEYVLLGAEFTKWRAILKIGEVMPSQKAIEANSQNLASFAVLSQEQGLVPIVEPEVLMAGDHAIEECARATTATLKSVFYELEKSEAYLPGLVLKTNMVVAGKESVEQSGPEEVAEATLRVLEETVPPEVPGVVFLSGGQSPSQATVNLNAIVKAGKGASWQLSFSFSRALQEEPLKAWAGQKQNFEAAQRAFYARAEKVSKAREGRL